MKIPDISVKNKVEEENNVVDLKLITGGKGTSNGNWLIKLPRDTVFLARPKNSGSIDLLEYNVTYKGDKAVNLLIDVDKMTFVWVDSLMFSQKMELVEIMVEGKD